VSAGENGNKRAETPKNKKEKVMTPSDMATSLDSMTSSGSIGLSTNFTQSWTGSGFSMDDANTYD
jgi:hypothetical protein